MKLRTTVLMTLLSIGLIGAASCGGVGPCELPLYTDLPSLATYSDYQVSMMYPADWEIDEEFTGYAGDGVTMGFMVADSTETTSCNLVLEDLPVAMSAEDYNKLGQQILEYFDEYHQICQETTYIDGMEAVKSIYEFEFLGISARQMQVSLVKGMEGWTFTYSTAPGQWDQWAYIFDFMANSIQIN